MPAREGFLVANGSTESVLTNGKYTVKIDGTFGGGTMQLQYMAKDGMWHDYDPTKYAFTATVAVTLDEVEQLYVRLTLSGATAPNVFYMIGV